MRNVFLGVFLLIMAFVSCSKSKENSAKGISAHEKNVPLQRPVAARQGDSSLRIASLTLVPEAPCVLDDVTAVPELANAGKENIEFRYQWFINGKEVEQIKGDTLGKSILKKGAWLYCQVRATDGRHESPNLRSDIIRVRNSLPVLDKAPVEEFGVPGDFHYQVVARDPDGEPLSYELLAPLDQGIELDPESGTLFWKIDEERARRLGDSVVIKFAVNDGEGEKVIGIITLKLTRSTKRSETP